MATADLSLKGMTVEQAYENITKAGVSKAEAATIIGAWIYENVGRTKRTFNYLTAFAATEPACAPTFERSFEHTDWIDGESVVQAEQTVGEDGFNARFHRIEDDLDALGGDVAKLFACLAEMRKDLRALLDEIRAELNRLNADVYQALGQGGRSPVQLGPIELQPNIEFEYLDTIKFLDQYVQVFKSSKGLMMLPAIEQIKVFPGADPRIQRTATLSRFVAEDPRVRERFKESFTLDEFIDVFGREEAANGMLVRELVGIVPSQSSFRSLDEMLDDVARREAAALRTSDTGLTAIINAFGLDVDVKTVQEAPVERFVTMPAAARTALVSAGIRTVGDLASTSPEQLVEVFQQQGVAASLGDAAEWNAGAKALGFTA